MEVSQTRWKATQILITLLGVVLSQLMTGFLLNNNLAPIGSSVISTCSPADLFEQREKNVPLASADVRGGGRLRDEPKERLRRRLFVSPPVSIKVFKQLKADCARTASVKLDQRTLTKKIFLSLVSNLGSWNCWVVLKCKNVKLNPLRGVQRCPLRQKYSINQQVSGYKDFCRYDYSTERSERTEHWKRSTTVTVKSHYS